MPSESHRLGAVGQSPVDAGRLPDEQTQSKQANSASLRHAGKRVRVKKATDHVATTRNNRDSD
jgi:hypothetical protein